MGTFNGVGYMGDYALFQVQSGWTAPASASRAPPWVSACFGRFLMLLNAVFCTGFVSLLIPEG